MQRQSSSKLGRSRHQAELAGAAEGQVVSSEQGLVRLVEQHAVVARVPRSVEDLHILPAVWQPPGASALQLHLALAAAQQCKSMTVCG